MSNSNRGWMIGWESNTTRWIENPTGQWSTIGVLMVWLDEMRSGSQRGGSLICKGGDRHSIHFSTLHVISPPMHCCSRNVFLPERPR